MPDFRQFVREHLPPLGLDAARELEITEELAQQFDQTYHAALAQGASEAEAFGRAQSQISDWRTLAADIRRSELTAAQRVIPRDDHIRHRRGGNMIADSIQDLRYAFRMLRKSSGFTALIVLTLALGMGANSAIFSIVNAELLRPLPYPNADRVLMIYESNLPRGFSDFSDAPAHFVDWLAQTRSFSRISAFSVDWYAFNPGADPQRLLGMAVTDGFLQTLGVSPLIGRDFAPQEFETGGGNVALLGYGFWQHAFAADPRVLGRSVTLDGKASTIIGVLPRGFDFEDSGAQVWMPLVFPPAALQSRGSHWLNVIGLVKPGVTFTEANADLARVSANLGAQYPASDKDWVASGVSLREDITGEVRPALLVLLGAVGLVLLIACANAANMLLARASVRRREIAIRTALGAGRARLIGQLLTESIVLSLAAGAAGLLFALAALRAVHALPPSTLPMPGGVNLDTRVLGFTIAITMLTALFFGLAPAILQSHSDVEETLKEATRGLAGGRGTRLRSALIITEVALALVLLAGSGLLLRSLARLSSVPTGFRTDHSLSFMLNLPGSRYATLEQQAEFFRQVDERMRALPGVEDVALTSMLPFSGHRRSYSTQLSLDDDYAKRPSAWYAVVSDDYFRVMGIPLLAGRFFQPSDTIGSPHVCILNDRLAKALFPAGDAVGHTVMFGRSKNLEPSQIVGVVATVKLFNLAEKPRFEGYEPLLQYPMADASVVLRTHGDPTALAGAVREQIHQLDPQQPVAEVAALGDLLGQSVAQPRFRAVLLAVFAVLALLLAAIGLYGVLAYSVAQRTQEIGIRMALGAQPNQVLRSVIARGMLLVAIGLALGAAAALSLGRLISAFLFGITPRDPFTLAAVIVVFAAIALVSCWIPARRAMRVDPLVALRYE
jgi:putative ABC transport system permease protein